MHEMKKYFEKIMTTRMANALRTVVSGKLQDVVRLVRADDRIRLSFRLYQYPILTSSVAASSAAAANHPTACWP